MWPCAFTLSRPLTFKDLARRVAMTKLANSDLSLEETEKYFGVHRKTVAVYHRSSNQSAIPAADLLRGNSTKLERDPVKTEDVAIRYVSSLFQLVYFCVPMSCSVEDVDEENDRSTDAIRRGKAVVKPDMPQAPRCLGHFP